MIAYASRFLNSAESKYSVIHLEALTVVWALKHFRDIMMVTPSLSTRTTFSWEKPYWQPSEMVPDRHAI